MTSGQFHSLPISDITVNREGRQRRDIADVNDLIDSISRLGLINPICITRDKQLVAGERRLSAVRQLGWTHIACQFIDELDDAALRAIELEENIKRKQLDWQDECHAVNEYHELRKSEKPDWSLEDTGNALGYVKAAISDRIRVAKEIASGNQRVIEAPRFSTARGIVDRKNARLDAVALEDFKATAKTSPEEAPPSIITADFVKWSETYSGPKFNFIHCDFPYGIGADKFNQGSAPTHGGYDDSEETYWRLCTSLCAHIDTLLSQSAHIMFWFSMHYYNDTIEFFNRHSDLVFDPFPLVWLKSDNIGILPDPQRGPRRIYETALFGSRGDRKIVRAKSNAYSAPSVRDTHMSIKPEPMLKHFIEMFVDESTAFLDPTCGSGSSVRAAESLGAAHVTGLEINEEFADTANQALKRARNMRKET